jgi:hypothetical protein
MSTAYSHRLNTATIRNTTRSNTTESIDVTSKLITDKHETDRDMTLLPGDAVMAQGDNRLAGCEREMGKRLIVSGEG